MIIIPGLRGFSFTVGSAEKNPRRVTFMRFHLRETAFVSFKVKVNKGCLILVLAVQMKPCSKRRNNR